jgi:hypothetical protein
MNFSEVVINLFSKWNKEQFVYCHWKSTNHLKESFLAKTDLDVLIDRSNVEPAVASALQLGFVELKTTHFRGYPSVRDFVAYDNVLKSWIHLHFHTQLICGDRWVKSYHLPFEKLILQNRVKHKDFDIWIISPEDELLILIYRMNAKFKKNWLLDKKIQIEINFLLTDFRENESSNVNKSGIRTHIDERANILFEQLINKDLDFLKLNINAYRKAFKIKEFMRMSSLRFFFLSKIRYIYRLYIEIKRRKFRNYDSGRRSLSNGGLVIAFVGIDGSGKTSGIKIITRFFAQQVNVQCNFLGSGKSGASLPRKLIMNLFGFKAKFKGHQEVRKANSIDNIENNKILKKPPFYYSIWVLWCTIDRERQLKKIQRGLANGKLVFVDRWLQDDVKNGVDAPRLYNYKYLKGLTGYVARREAKLYKKIKLIPLHQVLKLNIIPEVSLKRKPDELTYEGAEKAIKNMNNIRWPEGTQIIDIDATKEQTSVTMNMIDSIWHLLLSFR